MKRSFKAELEKSRGEGADPAAEKGSENANAESVIKKYSGMSESELMRELLNETNRQKKEGVFDRDSLQKGAEAILPMLNEEQKRKLYGIIGRL